MDHDLVFNVDEHDPCGETGFCKRCGVHESMASELNLTCCFATNTIALSHLRAAQINEELKELRREEARAYIRKMLEERGEETDGS